jgi:predicted anti-sigma-YlaC factor YlaD
MTSDAHQKAQQLITLGIDAASESERSWLQAHVRDCEDCRNYAQNVGNVVRSLRSLPLAADARLVRATQMRVRFHASRMQETRARIWFVGIACLGVGLTSAVTAPLLWKLFAWIGEQAGIATPVWQAGFVFFCIAPALLVSALLVARGTHLSDRERSQESK